MSHNFIIGDVSEFITSFSNKEFNLTFPDNFGYMNCKKEIVSDDIYIYLKLMLKQIKIFRYKQI